jgi:pimeloyl-ACP methyl ester carboxylesterase
VSDEHDGLAQWRSREASGYIPLLAALRGRSWIAINRPGGGLSDGVDHRRVDLRELAVELVDAVLDATGVERATVVCNSMGGLWGLWYAMARPARVERLVELGCPALLLGTSAPLFMRLVSLPGLGAIATRLMQPRSAAEARRGLNRAMRVPEAVPLSEALLAAYVAMSALPTFRPTWRTLIQAVLTPTGPRRRYCLGAEELASVAAPVLLLWGARDPFGDPSVGKTACRLLPSGRLEIVGEGHLPHLEQPASCAKAIEDFELAAAASR